jgi:hypothetical protein
LISPREFDHGSAAKKAVKNFESVHSNFSAPLLGMCVTATAPLAINFYTPLPHTNERARTCVSIDCDLMPAQLGFNWYSRHSVTAFDPDLLFLMNKFASISSKIKRPLCKHAISARELSTVDNKKLTLRKRAMKHFLAVLFYTLTSVYLPNFFMGLIMGSN